MINPVDVVLLDLGNTLYLDPQPWPEILKRAEAALWASLGSAGVTAEPQSLYGPYKSLIDLYNSDHRKDLTERTTRRVLADLLQKNRQPVSEEAVREALRAMYAVTQTNWILDPEAVPLLETLRASGYRLGAISNAADEDNTQALVDKAGIRPYLEIVISSAAFGRRKPDPGIFRQALAHFGVPAARAVMIGDSYEADIVGGKALGMHTIWICHEASGNDAAHTDADATVKRLQEIPKLLSR